MSYIIKDTAALISSRLTDAARKKISEGSFNITYFQVGDSEVCYNCASNMGSLSNGMVLNADYNMQNLSPLPEKNKANIKYPLRVTSQSTNTFGLPIKSSTIDNIFNTATPRGFFTGSSGSFSAQTSSDYTINPNYIVNQSLLNGATSVALTSNVIDATATGTPEPGHFVTFYCGDSADPRPITDASPILTYKVITFAAGTLTVDRALPDFASMGFAANCRVIFYPSGMTEVYDTYTPSFYWNTDAINFESNCDISQSDVKVWNMNIPWSETPAGVFSSTHIDHNNYTSSGYCGTKEYLGYNSNSGQTDSGGTYYYNSFSQKITVNPADQKAIAIVHYTNQAIDNFYGEKFAQQPYDATDPGATGQARNLQIFIPWLMWHKSTGATIGEVFYTDPPGFDGLNLFQAHHMESGVNSFMNNPGLRYYNLWDTNTNTNGYPNRVGKVWPDLKIITFDDEELVAVLNSKSDRNWTLPSPKLSLITPNSCGTLTGSTTGVISGSSEYMWVTYRFNSDDFVDALHCNYYNKIQGSDTEEANVAVRFGSEFPFLVSNPTTLSGFSANDIILLAQKVTGDTRPDPTSWVEVDVTSQISALDSGFIPLTGLTQTTFQITNDGYTGGTAYDLSNYITIPANGATSGITLNFGDDYYFYGNIETDIQATIYVMNYLCNLGQTQFLASTNPTWSSSDIPYITEIGLYDSDKNLMVISKVQSPEKRQGIQQYSIKIDI